MTFEEIRKKALGSLDGTGITVLKAGNGEALVEMELKPEHFNFMGIVYGGTLYFLADVAAGVASMNSGKGSGPTVSGNMQFLNAAHGTKLLGKARIVKAGRMLNFAEVEVTSPEGKLFCTAQFSFANTLHD